MGKMYEHKVQEEMGDENENGMWKWNCVSQTRPEC